MRKKVSLILVFAMMFLLVINPDGMIGASNESTISLMGIVYPDGGDRTSWIADAKESLYDMGHAVITPYIGFTATEFISAMDNQNMLVVHTHGSSDANGILAYKDGVGTLVTSEMIDETFDVDELSQMQICYIGACSQGAGGTEADNFVNTIYEHGALCVIGYKDSVVTSCNALMLKNFCYYISLGYQVDDALSLAQNVVYARYGTYGGVSNRLVRGDRSVSMTAPAYEYMGVSSTYLRLNNAMKADAYLDDEDNQVCSYVKIKGDNNYTSQGEVLSKEDFFENFELNGYQFETEQNDTSIMQCMRAYLNDIKTNDVIYYLVDMKGDLLAYGYPRVGNATEVGLNFSDIYERDIVNYVQDNYGVSEIEEIIIDVDDIDNPYVRVDFGLSEDGCERIDTITILLSDIIVER